jgi:hypothetical protein
MSRYLLLALLGLITFEISAQDDIRAKQAAQVRNVVQGLGQKQTRASVLTRSLVFKKGKVVQTRDESFDLRVRKGVVPTISYADVLELDAGGKFVSFIPERTARNHGRWEDVGVIYPGTRILVIYPDGKSTKGFSNSVTKANLVMVDENGRQRVEIDRDNVLAVYGLVGGYGGVKKGAAKGVEAMNSSRDKLLGGVFVGIGALLGLAKSDGTPILIYSK